MTDREYNIIEAAKVTLYAEAAVILAMFAIAYAVLVR